MSQAVTATPGVRVVGGRQVPEVGSYAVDPSHASFEFVARHLMAKTRGKFFGVSGVATVAERPEDSTLEIEIDTTSIDTGDETRDAQDDDRQRRVGRAVAGAGGLGAGHAPRVGVEPTSLVLIQSQAGPADRPPGDRLRRSGAYAMGHREHPAEGQHRAVRTCGVRRAQPLATFAVEVAD